MPFLEKMSSPKDATSPLMCVDRKACTILFPGKETTFKVILIAGKESCNVICVIVLCSAGIWKNICSYLSLLSLHQGFMAAQRLPSLSHWEACASFRLLIFLSAIITFSLADANKTRSFGGPYNTHVLLIKQCRKTKIIVISVTKKWHLLNALRITLSLGSK